MNLVTAALAALPLVLLLIEVTQRGTERDLVEERDAGRKRSPKELALMKRLQRWDRGKISLLAVVSGLVLFGYAWKFRLVSWICDRF